MTKKSVKYGIVGCFSIIGIVVYLLLRMINSINESTKPLEIERTALTGGEFRREYKTFPKEISAQSISYYTYSHFQAYLFAVKITCESNRVLDNAERLAKWATDDKAKVIWKKEFTVKHLGLHLPAWMDIEKFDGVFETPFIDIWYDQTANAIYMLQTD